MIALAIGAFVSLALAVMLTSFSFGEPNTRWTPSPTKEVFDWVLSVAPIYRHLTAAVLGCSGVAMAVAAVRRYNALSP